MSNIPAGAWRTHEGHTWPNDVKRFKPYRVVPQRSALLKCLVFRVYLHGYTLVPIFAAMSIESAMTFIGRRERGQLFVE